ncbi:MAG: uracil-DNA glycosylase [Acidobacteria bacterium OLB17]|nr:MAG: uracil-DNA glycosylase [Acidobacteria bacterium OLB17]MCZ2391718.1 uracil-DNA glycosylase [Acidobacteriota bacterium]
MRRKIKEFRAICEEARVCTICPDLADKTAVLSELNGSLSPKVFFVGEAPGRAGADRTRRPFTGDKSGENLQILLDSIGLSRDDVFFTSAVMCSPRSATDANRKPTRAEVRNCSSYLRRLIELLDPPVVATLGAVGLDALKLIEPHAFTLKEHAGSIQHWNGRVLVPLYHPSPLVIASQRGLDVQLATFRTLKVVLDN